MVTTYIYTGTGETFIPGVGAVKQGGQVTTSKRINNTNFKVQPPPTNEEIQGKMRKVRNYKK